MIHVQSVKVTLGEETLLNVMESEEAQKIDNVDMKRSLYQCLDAYYNR